MVIITRGETILTIIADRELALKLAEWATDHGYKIVEGDPDSPDSFAIPFWVAVIDKEVMTKSAWDQLVGYWKEFEKPWDDAIEELKGIGPLDPEPYIVLTNEENLKTPSSTPIFIFRKNESNTSEKILSIFERFEP